MALAVVLGGCDDAKKGDDGKADDGKKAEKPKPEPFEGPLTTDLLMGTKKAVSPFDDWEEARAKIEGMLGKPTLVEGKDYSWAVVDGDKCSYLTVEDAGGQVGTVEGPSQVDRMMKSMFNGCAAKAGQKIEEPKEDPDAPGPPDPKEGTAVKPSQIVAGIAAAKSKWIGAQVRVEGVYVSTTTSSPTGSDDKTCRSRTTRMVRTASAARCPREPSRRRSCSTIRSR